MKIVIELEPGTPERIRRVLGSVLELDVTDGRSSTIDIDGVQRGLVILPRPQPGLWPDLDRDVKELARGVPRGSVGLVVAGTIPVAERDAVERANLSWCDGRGALHLTWPGGYVHIDRATRRRGTGKAQGEQGLGPASIRAVQVMLETDGTEWTVSHLAQTAAISVGQAHTVLRVLEENGLLRRAGKGPLQRSEITDRRAALDWLASIDRARRRPKAAATYLYARTSDEVLKRFAALANEAGLPYAVTGAAASNLVGAPALTRVPVAHVRVGVLEAVDALHRLNLEHLDAEDAGRGANLELWTDTGELGVFGAKEVDGVRVAPLIRIWLDLAREGGRGEDAAQIFREQIIERA
jgi:hypothetical protein